MTSKKLTDNHHIIPRSRGGKNKGTVEIKMHLHQKYHTLFANRTPEEIIDFLVNYFWGGRGEYVKNYLRGKTHLKEFNELFNVKEEGGFFDD